MKIDWSLAWPHEPEDGFFVDRDRQFQVNSDVEKDPGTSSERFELRRLNISKSDSLGSPRYERCEKSEVGDRQRRGDEHYYRWSFRVPMSFPEANHVDETSNQVILAQFQQEPADLTRATRQDWKPAWMFGKRIGGPFCVRLFPTIDLAQATWWSLIDHDKFCDVWHDIVVHAKWSGDSKGIFRIWVNGVPKMAYFGKNCSDHDGRIYHKYGIYRAHHASNETAVAYFSHLSRGSIATEAAT